MLELNDMKALAKSFGYVISQGAHRNLHALNYNMVSGTRLLISRKTEDQFSSMEHYSKAGSEREETESVELCPAVYVERSAIHCISIFEN